MSSFEDRRRARASWPIRRSTLAAEALTSFLKRRLEREDLRPAFLKRLHTAHNFIRPRAFSILIGRAAQAFHKTERELRAVLLGKSEGGGEKRLGECHTLGSVNWF